MQHSTLLRRLTPFLLAGFSIFIVVIIALRNAGRANGFFEFVGALPYHDKIGHFVLMGILSLLAVVVIAPRLRLSPRLATTIVVATLVALITIEELSQQRIPSRSFSLMDLACSVVGALSFGVAGHALTTTSDEPRELDT